LKEKRRNDPQQVRYRTLNLIFLVLLGLVWLYAALNNPDKMHFPVPSGPEWFFGLHSPSAGLAHSFSALVRFQFYRGVAFNPHGPRLFLFFALQSVMRISALIFSGTIFWKKPSRLYAIDIALSLILFVILFWPFLNEWLMVLGTITRHSLPHS
jgi:hypothetical protein